MICLLSGLHAEKASKRNWWVTHLTEHLDAIKRYRGMWPSPMWYSVSEKVQLATTVNGTLTQLSLQTLCVLHCGLSHTFTQLPAASFLQTAEQTLEQMTVLSHYHTHTSETGIFFSSIAILRDHCCVCGLCRVEIVPDLCIKNTWSSVWNNMI